MCLGSVVLDIGHLATFRFSYMHESIRLRTLVILILLNGRRFMQLILSFSNPSLGSRLGKGVTGWLAVTIKEILLKIE
jgi:hypothetical protein